MSSELYITNLTKIIGRRIPYTDWYIYFADVILDKYIFGCQNGVGDSVLVRLDRSPTLNEYGFVCYRFGSGSQVAGDWFADIDNAVDAIGGEILHDSYLQVPF